MGHSPCHLPAEGQDLRAERQTALRAEVRAAPDRVAMKALDLAADERAGEVAAVR